MNSVLTINLHSFCPKFFKIQLFQNLQFCNLSIDELEFSTFCNDKLKNLDQKDKIFNVDQMLNVTDYKMSMVVLRLWGS